jgi:hypothetical protein
VVSDIPGETIVEGGSFATINLDDYVSDIDNLDSEINWTYSGNTELLVDITARVATITTPTPDWNGSETITFTATDPGLLFDSDPATFTVTAVNDAPVVSDIPNQTVPEGSTFTTITLDDYVSDVDNLDSEISWTYAGNTELTVSIVNRVATITIPDIEWSGSETITFTATDPGLLSDSDPATFTVTAVNDVPVVSDIPDQTIAEGSSFTTITLDDYVSDIDNLDSEINWTYAGNTELTVDITARVATITIPSADWNGSETITFTATDPGLLSDSDPATFTVTAVNDAPVVADIPNQSVAEGSTFTTITLDDYVSDIDNLDSEISWTYAGNTELTVDITARVATITTPNPDWYGSETITFTATDPGLLNDSDPATFTVTAVNDAPVVSDIPDQTIGEGASFATIALDNYVNDVDNLDAEISWTYAGNTELTVSIVNRVATVTIPNPDWNGSETITFTATDPGLLFDSDPATFTVTGVNDAPIVSDIPNQTVAEGSTFTTITLDDYVSDVDNLDSEISWTYAGNTELTVDITARVATITIPDIEWSGSETITFTATDPGLLFDSDPATFTVTAVNDAPVVSDIPDQTIAEGSSFTTIALDNYVTDIDNLDSEMNWSYSGNTELSVSIDLNRVATITVPNPDWNGSETITFTATDPGLQFDSDAAAFTVTGINDAPVVVDIPNQTVAEGSTFTTITLDDFVSDVDNLDNDISWTYAGNTELAVDITARVATITIPDIEWSGSETITFTATDPGLLSDSDPATFTVTAVNDAPVVSDIPGQSVAEGTSFAPINLDNYVTDIDNIVSELTWSYSGNSQLSVSIVNRVAVVTAPHANWNGSETITFTATDPGLLSDSDPATFTVTGVNDAPVVSNIPNQTIVEGASFATITLDNYVSDIDNLDSEMSWTYSGNSELSVSIDVNRIATVTVPSPQWNGSETITFTATDPGLLNSSDLATFTVTPTDDAPVVSDIPDQTVAEGSTFTTITLDDYVADPDNLDNEMSWTYSGNTELSVSISVARIATISIPDPDWNGSELITFTATDPTLLSNSDPATFTVTAVNDAPVVGDIPDQSVSEGSGFATVNLDNYITDVDNLDSEISWTYSGNTELSVVIDGSRVATITAPSADWNGAEAITFTATDPGLLNDSDPAIFTVTGVNDAPVVGDIPNQTIAEGASFAAIALDNYVVDIDNLDSEISWTYSGNSALTVSINGSRVATITVPGPDWNGVETITFTATDPGLLADSDPATFTVTAVNDAPVVSGIPDQTIDEGASFTTINLDNYVADVDNLDSEMSWSYSGNIQLSVSIVNRLAIITTPSPDWNGSETITFTATDPALSAGSDQATFTVTGVNDAPVVGNIPNQTISEGSTFATVDLDSYVSDVDNLDNEITWSWEGQTQLSVSLNVNRVATITIPNADWNGSETITFTATDPGLLSDSDPATFTVTAINDAPVVSDIPDQTVAEGSSFTTINLDNYVDDVDNADNQISWTYSGNTELTVSIVSRVAAIGIPSPEWNGAETITFTATDPGLLSDNDAATFTVTAVNNAPVVSDIPSQSVPEGSSFTTIALDDYVTDSDNLDSEISWAYSGNTQLGVSIVNRVATITIPDPDWNGSEVITFTATDPGLLSDSDPATFTVTGVNDAPIVSNIPSQTIAEGASFATITLDNYVSDIDNTDAQMNWTYSGNSELSVVIDINRIATITPPSPTWNGSETITFTATDPGLLSDSDSATFTVNAVNNAPVVSDIPNQTISEGGSFTTINLDNHVSDIDNLDSEISWTYSGNTALLVNISASRVATITTPNPDWHGSEIITFTATDPSLLSNSDPATFTVTPVNDAPNVGDIPNQTITEGASFTSINLDNYVTDVDDLASEMSWSYAGNVALTVSITNRVAIITIPSTDWNGVESITFTATDPGSLSDFDAALFTVTAVNDAPIVTNIPSQTISEGQTFATINLDAYVSDVDNLDAEMDWTWEGNTALSVSIGVNRIATVTIPSPDWFGTETITFTATDPGLLSDSDPATFAVTAVNDAPVVSDIPNQTIAEGSSFATISLDNYVTDVDNTDDQIVWTYAGNAELTVSINTGRIATIGIPSSEWSGSETITFTATDPGLLFDNDAATFTVTAVNDAPVVGNIPDQTVPEGSTFTTITLDTYVTDLDHAPSEMAWTYAGNSQLSVSISAGRIATITIPNPDWNGTEVITFTATDPGLLSDSDPATFTVTAVNDAPVVSNIPNQTIAEGASFTTIALDDYVVDIDNSDNQITWTYSGNTELSVSIDVNRIATISPPSPTWDGSEVITFTATDPGLLSDSDPATFTVTAVNDAPVVSNIPDQTVAEGGTFTTINLDDYVTDIDNLDSEISWTYSGNTELSVSISVSRVATITIPNPDWNGSELITFTATDPSLLSNSDPANFTVTAINDAPVVGDIPNQTIAEGASFTSINLDNYVTDVDNLASEMAWGYAGNVELSVAIVNRVAIVTTPSANWTGFESITFTATDPGSLSHFDAAVFTVTPVNDAPVVSNIPNQTIAEGATFATIDLDSYVSDVDNLDSEISWSWVGNTALSVSLDVNRVATITIPSPDWNGSETITFEATDPGLLTDSDPAVFTVTAVNDAPVVSDIPDQTVAEGATFATINLDNFVTDVDNIDNQISWTFSGNTELTVDITNRVATIAIPSPTWNGSEVITFRATDPGLLFDEDAAIFTVTAVNNAPVVADIPGQTISEGSSFTTISLDGYVSDIDNLPSQMTWTYTGNTQLSVSINASRIATITIPNPDWNGVEIITFTATDPGLLSDSDPATFTVTAINDAPVVSDIPDQTIAEGASFAAINLDDYVSDVDNPDSEIEWTYSGNSELTVNIVSRVATVSTPSSTWNGSETITFTATDPGLLNSSDLAVFTVSAVNDGPVVSDIPNQTIAEGSTFGTITLDNYVTDIDNIPADMSWSYSGNTELTVSISAGRVATITVPDPDWNGSETITFTATDPGLLSDSDPATFTVTGVNDPPIVSNIPSQTIAEGASFATINLDDYVSDIDNPDNTINWVYSGNIELTVIIDINRVATINVPSPTWNGSETITFTATDPGLLSDSDSATFTVTAVNNAPVVSDIPNQTITEGGTFTTIALDDHVTDVDNLDSEISWTYSGNTALLVSISGSRVATISTPDPDWNGSETITFTATDPSLLSNSDPATFTVTPANDAPVVGDIPNQTISEGASFTSINLDNYVTDVDNLASQMSWSYAGNVALSVSIVNRIAIITTPSSDWNGVESITFTATDPGLLSDFDAAVFTVTAVNDAPIVTNIPSQTIVEGSTFATIPLDTYVSDVDNLDAEMAWSWEGNTQLTVSIDVNRVATVSTPSPDWNGSETITFTATDPGLLGDADPATFTVTAVNDAPIVGDIPDQTVTEGLTFTSINLNDYVTDVDNADNQMSWSYAGNTELTVSIDPSRIATITIPSPTWNGSETITFTATDPGLLSDSDDATFTVTAINNAPVVGNIPSQTVSEGSSFTTIALDSYVSDVDNLDSEISWTYSGNTELLVSIDLNRMATVTVPNPDWNGSEVITFTATDPGLLSDSDPATFTVTGVNDAPVVSDIPDQTIAEGGSFATISLDNYVSDVDNGDNQMDWSYAGNTELSVSISAGRIATITIPSPTWNGSETITFTAADPGLLSDSDPATFTVTSVNNAPVVSDIPNQTVAEGSSFTTIILDNYVTDADNLDSEISWSSSGNVELLVSIDAGRIATITIPQPDWNGSETITFAATDPDLLSDSDAATFTVTAINDPPIVSDIPNQTIAEGASFASINLDDYVTDVDNAASEMTWTYSGNVALSVSIVNRVAIVTTPSPDWNGVESISFTARDPGLLSDSDPAVFTVTAVNDAPIVGDIPDQTIAEGATFATINLDSYVTDVDNLPSEMTWSWVGNTQLMVSINVSRVATITIPSPDWNGSETITFTATDPGLLFDNDPATFTVTAVNDAPVVGDIPDQTVAEGGSFTSINLDDYAADVDNPDSELSWTFAGNTELTVDITNRVATISIPSPNWNGSETITFTATDPGLLSDSDPATFTVSAVNNAPVVSDIPDQTVNEGSTFTTISLDNYVDDIDNPDPEITWTYAGNTELTVSIDVSRIATITIPDVNWNGSEVITFTATDPGLLNDSDPATFTVTSINDEPVLSAIGPQSTPESTPLSFGVSATDDDGEIPALTTSALPGTSVFNDNGNGTGIFDWTPSFIDAGVYPVTFYAEDALGAIDSEVVTITVVEVGNQPPVLDSIGSRNVQESSILSFTVTASDAESIPSLRAEGLPGTATFGDNGNGTADFDWNTTLNDAGVYIVLFIAEDDSLAADSESVTITVGNTNQDPTANAGPDQGPLSLGTLVALDGSASSDPDGDSLGYHWRQISGPAVVLSDSNAVNPTFTATTAGTIVLELKVDDATVTSPPDLVTITVFSEPSAVVDLNAAVVGNTIQLTWSDVTTDTSGAPTSVSRYVVYRGTSAYFAPTPADSIGNVLQGQQGFTDNNIGGADVVGDTGTNYFYCILAVDVAAGRSALSNRVGEYDYRIFTTSTTDYTLIMMPFANTGITTASDLIQSIGVGNVNTVNRYVAASQSYESRFAAGFGTNFAVVPGGIYQVNASAPTIFSVAGRVPAPGSVSYPIVTTSTTDFSFIAIPFEEELNYATAQDVIDALPGVLNTLNRFRPASQSYESRFAAGFGTNFPVRPGQAYQANAATTGTFPVP